MYIFTHIFIYAPACGGCVASPTVPLVLLRTNTPTTTLPPLLVLVLVRLPALSSNNSAPANGGCVAIPTVPTPRRSSACPAQVQV